MVRPKDYYRLLGVPRDATSAAIKRAYRRLAKELHPDVSQSSTVEGFRELQAAYETLADADARRLYDETLAEREESEARSWSFMRGPAFSGLRRPVSPGAMSAEILLSPAEAAAGGVLPIDVPVTSQCPVCEGTGGELFDCMRCDGEGVTLRRLPLPVHLPPGIRDGTVYQVSVDDPLVRAVLLTVHIRAL